MRLDGKEIEITDIDGFFAVMDTFEKKILSTDISKGVPETNDFVVFVVSDHAIGLPKESVSELGPHFKYI